jgi:hypothetical protein
MVTEGSLTRGISKTLRGTTTIGKRAAAHWRRFKKTRAIGTARKAKNWKARATPSHQPAARWRPSIAEMSP